jgi:molybdate transport system substrate-binding protein
VLIAAKDSKIERVGSRMAAASPWPTCARCLPVLYAKAALENLGVWAAVQDKLAQAENVRAALSYVSRGEAPLGIVYATDAKIERGVKIFGTFLADSHPPIVYPVAPVAGHERESVARYLQFLRG